jgi:hypothetical protein
MQRFAKLLVVTVGFGALGFVMSLVPQKTATGAGGAPVNVVNSIPLTVTGNVGITGTPNVNVGNFPSVQPVSFSNSSGTPLFVDVDAPARSAVSGTCHAALDGSGSATCEVLSVPVGKTLVVDTLTAEIAVTSGKEIVDADVSVSARDVSGSVQTFFYILPVKLIGTDPITNHDFYVFTSPLTLYAVGGTAVSGRAFTTDTSASGLMGIGLSGHLVAP